MNIAPYIDHTVLKPTAIVADIKRLCDEARKQHFAAVCVPPYYVADAKKLLQDTNIKVATVIGFPLGYSSTVAKVAEIHSAIHDGADELDIVHNITALKNRNWAYLATEVAACLKPIKQAGKAIKIILESGVLTDEELIKCCDLYKEYDIDFIKTSTGYADTGATVHAVKLIRAHLPRQIAIKASGGIRNFTFAKELIDAGATRIGSSAGMQIIKESIAAGD